MDFDATASGRPVAIHMLVWFYSTFPVGKYGQSLTLYCFVPLPPGLSVATMDVSPQDVPDIEVLIFILNIAYTATEMK